MSDEVATRIIVFGWIAVMAVAVFAWFSVAHWINARTAERKDRERNALLRHLAGQPAETARLVLDKMREDEEQARKDAAAKFVFWMQERKRASESATPGLIITAAGVGACILLYSVTPDHRAWTLGVIPVLIGAVATAVAIFRKRD